jgi:hypothetical protein
VRLDTVGHPRRRPLQLLVFDLRHHDGVAIGMGELHLLAWARCPIDDVPGADPGRDELVAQRRKVMRIQPEDDGAGVGLYPRTRAVA